MWTIVVSLLIMITRYVLLDFQIRQWMDIDLVDLCGQ